MCTSARNGKNQPSGCWIQPVKRLAIYLRDDFRCVYCGRELRKCKPCEITLDHVVSRSHGGGNESENLVTACKSCNCARRDKRISEFVPPSKRVEINRLRRRSLRRYMAVAKRVIG